MNPKMGSKSIILKKNELMHSTVNIGDTNNLIYTYPQHRVAFILKEVMLLDRCSK
jgi:hypothetical protein